MATPLNSQDSTLLLNIKPAFSTRQSEEEYFDDWKFQKDSSDVAEFFTSYLESPGFDRILKNQKEWWKQRHPYRKWIQSYDRDGGTYSYFKASKTLQPIVYTVDMPSSLSFQTNTETEDGNRQPVSFVGTWEDSEFPFNFVLGHEYWHGKTPRSFGELRRFYSGSGQQEALQQNTNTNQDGHDEKEYEKHADKQGLIYLLYKDGIYDARSDKDITIEQVKQAREKYPNLRPFQQMTDEQIQFQINNVAHHKHPMQESATYARCGNRLNYLNYSK